MGDCGGSIDDVVPAEPQDGPASRREPPVALLVASTIDQPVVERRAVDLDDDPRTAEEEVDAPDPTESSSPRSTWRSGSGNP